jgi:hypothetical protein
VETEDAKSASQGLRPQRRQQQLIAGHLTQQQQRYQSRQLQMVQNRQQRRLEKQLEQLQSTGPQSIGLQNRWQRTQRTPTSCDYYDFGQPHVTTTSVVPEVERRAAAAAAELVEQKQQQQFSDTGGVRAGDRLIFRPGTETAVVGHKGFVAAAGWEGEERAFEASTECVVQADWHPSYGRRVMVAGSAEGAGWLVAEDGERISGVWAVAPELLCKKFQVGIVGTVWDEGSEGEVTAVEAFHWPSQVEMHFPDRSDCCIENDGMMGTITSRRKVKLVAIEEYARGTEEMLLVEDAELVECDIVSDFDVGLNFDVNRSCRESHQPFIEIPADTAGSGGGCVVEMISAYYEDPRVMHMVRRSSVWVRGSSWDTVPLQ